MRKELYLAKSEARHYAESFAEDFAGATVEEPRRALADARTEFDYIDRDMVDWSGELSGFLVRNEDGTDLAIFAYLDEEK